MNTVGEEEISLGEPKDLAVLEKEAADQVHVEAFVIDARFEILEDA
jgi:hypothetical protein